MKLGYLVHYGTPRHSGRYPWGSGKRPKQRLECSKNEETIVKASELVSKKLKSFTYGTVVDGKIYTNLDAIPWDRYKTLTISQMNKYKVGTCWDFVNYQHNYFKKMGIKNDSFLFVKPMSENPNDIATHTFSILEGDKWFESRWAKHQGINKVQSYKDVADILNKDFNSKYDFELYKYNPDGMIGLSSSQFFKKATSNGPILASKTQLNKS